MLFPITLQLLRCLPFERAVFYLPIIPPSRSFTDENTDAFLAASARQTAKLTLSCVSDVRRILSCKLICLGDEIFLFVWRVRIICIRNDLSIVV